MRKPDLSKLHLTGGPNVPTMIVPPGTQIQVDREGQVSIRTPGNLVLQNSGAYATLESVSGSIRIEPSVHVEAVTVRCAETCLVQGTLTAWRVVARMLHVDSDAEVHVVMQETEKLEVGKNGRLVGNFRSEKELYELFSRFASNMRALPAPLLGEEPAPPSTVIAQVEPVRAEGNGAHGAAGSEAPQPEPFTLGEDLEADAAEGGEAAAPAAGASSMPPPSLPDPLSLALLLLEQGQQAGEVGAPAARRSLAELVRLLREGDLETLRHTYKTLFARLADGGEGVRRARRAVGTFFESEIEHPAG
jgi:hypothetical protein